MLIPMGMGTGIKIASVGMRTWFNRDGWGQILILRTWMGMGIKPNSITLAGSKLVRAEIWPII